MGDPKSDPVDRDETIDLSLQGVVEELLDAAQISQPFLPHGPGERDRSLGFDLESVERPDHADDDGQTAAIVSDAGPVDHRALARGPDDRTLGENRVEVGREDQVRARRAPGTLAQDVAGPVDPHVLQAELFEELPVGLAALALL